MNFSSAASTPRAMFSSLTGQAPCASQSGGVRDARNVSMIETVAFHGVRWSDRGQSFPPSQATHFICDVTVFAEVPLEKGGQLDRAKHRQRAAFDRNEALLPEFCQRA